MILLAQSVKDVFGTVSPPPELKTLTDQPGAGGINVFLTKSVQLIYMVAAVVFVFQIITGAYRWMTSGGEKEALQKAQETIVHAIIGITILALTFLILTILGTFLGFSFFNLGFSGQCFSNGQYYRCF